MKEFEFSHDAVADLDEQSQKVGGDAEQNGDDPVEQTLEVPTERSADDAVKYVQKQYKDKSGLDLDDDSAREIVNTARADDGGSDESDQTEEQTEDRTS